METLNGVSFFFWRFNLSLFVLRAAACFERCLVISRVFKGAGISQISGIVRKNKGIHHPQDARLLDKRRLKPANPPLKNASETARRCFNFASLIPAHFSPQFKCNTATRSFPDATPHVSLSFRLKKAKQTDAPLKSSGLRHPITSQKIVTLETFSTFF